MKKELSKATNDELLLIKQHIENIKKQLRNNMETEILVKELKTKDKNNIEIKIKPDYNKKLELNGWQIYWFIENEIILNLFLFKTDLQKTTNEIESEYDNIHIPYLKKIKKLIHDTWQKEIEVK